MLSNDGVSKRHSLPKLLGVAILVAVIFVGMQFQKQLRQPLLFSSFDYDPSYHLSIYAMEATALLFGSNSNNTGSSKPTNNTILVSNPMFTRAAEQNQKKKKRLRNIFFIHVGKTGGTTLRETVLRYGCRLYGSDKAKANCHKFLEKHGGESALGKRTQGIFHYQQKRPSSKKQINKMDWMFVIREPIARFMSSYEYINPHNCIQGKKERNMDQKCNRQFQAQNFPASFPSKFFYDCFPKVQDFLHFQPLTKKNKGKRKKKKHKATGNHDGGLMLEAQRQKCNPLWKGAFVPGLFNDYGHMTANYQYYTKGLKLASKQQQEEQSLNDTRNVYVIRTEHLWEDVSRIDALVGGAGNFSHVQGKIINRQTTTTKSTRTMNATVRNTTTLGDSNSEPPQQQQQQQIMLVPLTFCCALLPDMLAFRNIVNRADNLSEEQKHETNAMSYRRCNVTSWGGLQSKCGKPTKKGMK
ncbi:unnamed protein product [Cylindrotheca closterium]|uniref:Sulfotransferase domain-containing protein n=1 Tax=Cylindrotheca closterium TaxID=2856 RepID=A0AAD2CXG2_9STRA|nr:unnamed protein product [Cylindrotheca closterium]